MYFLYCNTIHLSIKDDLMQFAFKKLYKQTIFNLHLENIKKFEHGTLKFILELYSRGGRLKSHY